jgi:hypothetical protein
MSQGPPTPPDPSKLSPEVAQLIEQAVQAERAATEAERNARQAAEAEAAELKAYNEKLEHLVKEFERAKFGRSSEKLDPEQKELVFEDVETAISAAQAEHHDKQGQSAGGGKKSGRAKSGKARPLPKQLPKDEEYVEPQDTECPCGCGQMKKIGETRSRRLDITPTQYRIKETVQPRYACPHGNAGVTQAKAPAHLIEGGLPTEALIASIIVAKYSEHRVSWNTPNEREVWNCVRDEGGPLGFGDQALIPNHRELLSLRAMVVSVAETAGLRSRQVRSEETSESEPLQTGRNCMDDVKTGVWCSSRDKCGRSLETGPRGVRLEGGVNSDQALTWNRRTCRPDAKGDGRAGDSREAKSTDAEHRDRTARSRVESAVSDAGV